MFARRDSCSTDDSRETVGGNPYYGLVVIFMSQQRGNGPDLDRVSGWK